MPLPRGRLAQAVPESETLLDLAFAQGESAGSQTAQLLKLLDQYGAAALRRAIREALERNTPRASSVAFLLRRQQRSAPRRDWPSISAVTPKPNPSTFALMIWRPTMNSPTPRRRPRAIACRRNSSRSACAPCPRELDDFLARATKARWSPRQMLEQLAQAEIAERSRRSLERRLRLSGIKSFKPMADFEWTWPTKIERDVIERALTLDFLPRSPQSGPGGPQRFGQNHDRSKHLPRRRAGRLVRFCSVPPPALLEELHRQTPEGRRRKLRSYANVGLVMHR